MKNTILIFILALVSQSAFAQIQKGAGYFGGTLFGYINKGDDKQNSSSNITDENFWNFNVSYGHYITDRIAIGLGAGISLSDFKNENTGVGYSYKTKQTSTQYYVSPFLRTSKKIADNFFCFGELGLRVGAGTTNSTNSSLNTETQVSDGTQLTLGAGLTGGLNYFLSRHFAFSLTYGNISYYSTTTEIDDESGETYETTRDGLSLNLGLSSITIGLQYFINNTSEKK